MAKSGRAFADRKKIKNLNCFGAATLAIDTAVAECGTIFVMTPAGDDANEGATITLPPVSDAGNGWWCKFVLNDAIVSDSNDVNDIVIQNDAGDTNDMIVGLPADAGADGVGAANGQSVTFAEGAAQAGDEVEVICLGSRWYIRAHCAVVGGVTKQ